MGPERYRLFSNSYRPAPLECGHLRVNVDRFRVARGSPTGLGADRIFCVRARFIRIAIIRALGRLTSCPALPSEPSL